MHSSWTKPVIPIAALYACRILGLFLLIPVFTLFASHLSGATPQLIGIALGAYGLTQACMQIPFGILSDRWGRKPLITIGLLFLITGGFIGAHAHSIWEIILARSLQGAGAIGSVLLALLSDLTPVSHRAKAMAIIGASIGISFSLAMIISPFILEYFGSAGLFYLIAILGSLGLVVLFTLIPTPTHERQKNASPFSFSAFTLSFSHPRLRQLNLGIFLQHACLTSTFYLLPLLLEKWIKEGQLATTWHFYLPVIVCSFLLMAPLIVWAEKKQHLDTTLKLAVFLIFFAQICLGYFHTNWFELCGLMFIYFVAFNLIEAILPSQVSKCVPAELRGTAMGIYSTFQFLGIFMGAILAGWLSTHWSHAGIFWTNATLGLIWLSVLWCPLKE